MENKCEYSLMLGCYSSKYLTILESRKKDINFVVFPAILNCWYLIWILVQVQIFNLNRVQSTLSISVIFLKYRGQSFKVIVCLYIVVSSLWLMTSHKKAPSFSGRASSWVHICAMKYQKLVTICSFGLVLFML